MTIQNFLVVTVSPTMSDSWHTKKNILHSVLCTNMVLYWFTLALRVFSQCNIIWFFITSQSFLNGASYPYLLCRSIWCILHWAGIEEVWRYHCINFPDVCLPIDLIVFSMVWPPLILQVLGPGFVFWVWYQFYGEFFWRLWSGYLCK